MTPGTGEPFGSITRLEHSFPTGTEIVPGGSIDLGYPTMQEGFVSPQLLAVAADHI